MLEWIMGIKQRFDNIGSKLADSLKCRSNCCNNVTVYSPRNCGIFGSVSNRWIEQLPPIV